MKSLLSVFIMGSEMRQFVHAGLFTKLLKSGWNITVMSKIIDEDMRDQLQPEIELIPMVHLPHSLLAETSTKILDKAYSLYRIRRGESTWQYGSVKLKNWRETLLHNFINTFAWVISYKRNLPLSHHPIENWLYQQVNRSIWKEWFRANPVDAILINVPTQLYWNPMLVTAQEMGIKTYLVYHTSKDIIANPRLNHKFTRIGVWNTQMKQDLLRLNPWVDAGTVQVVGCGHFDCVGRIDWLPQETDFRKQIGASPDSYLVLYPTSGPGIVPNEERYIDLVVKAINNAEIQLNKKIQMVFRINPMDNRDEFSHYLRERYPENIVLRPDWQDIRKSNWTYARKSDPVFYNALLHFSSLCVTIPSTVTVDCALSGLPIINLGIEVPGEQPLAGSIKAFWEVDFNRNVRKTGAARFVTDEAQLLIAMTDYLQDKSLDADKREGLIMREVDGLMAEKSSERTYKLITAA